MQRMAGFGHIPPDQGSWAPVGELSGEILVLWNGFTGRRSSWCRRTVLVVVSVVTALVVVAPVGA